MQEAYALLEAAYQTSPAEVTDKKGSDRVMDTAWRAAEAFLRGLTLFAPALGEGTGADSFICDQGGWAGRP
jgi:hypothetical protein